MSLENCVLEAKAWAEEHSELKLNKTEIEELGRFISAANDAGATPAQKMQLMQAAVTGRIELAQAARRGENYSNTIKNLQNAQNVAKNIDLWGNKINSAPDAIEAVVTGKSSKPGFGVNQDPLAASRANTTRFLGFLENAFTKQESKLAKTLSRGDDLSKGIDQEIDALRNKTQLGLSGSEIALSMAKKFREAGDAMFKETQAVNPYLRENALYLASRSWNRDLVAKVDQPTFVADMKSWYGKNFIGSDEQINKMLGKMYTDIKSGLPPEMTDMTPRFWEPPGTGGSQAIQSSGHRVLIQNDWQSENAAQAAFGDSHYNAYVKQAMRQADYVATVNKWGTKASEGFNKLFNSVYNSLEDPASKERLLQRKADLQEKFDATQASRDNSAWTIKGRLAQGLVSAENLSMLGNHVPRTLSSGPAILSQIRNGYGMNIFEQATSIAQTFAKLVRHLPDAGASEMQHWRVSSMSVSRDLSNQLLAGNTGQPLGVLGKLARLASKATLADWTTNAWKFIMAESDTRILGNNSERAFSDLHPAMQNTLQRYGIGKSQWEVLRHATDSDGRLTPEALQKVPDEIMNQLNTGGKAARTGAADAQRIRGELAQNLGTLLNDRASMSVAESNAASRAQAYGTSNINSMNGIGRNFFYQFKQASLVRQQLLMRTLQAGGDNTSNIGGTIQYMLQMATAGAIGQQLIELGAWRQPLDMRDPKIFAHMLESTGVGGFYGSMLADFFTSPEPNMMKKMVQGDFLGPSFGTIIKAGEAGWRTGRGVVQAAEGHSSENQYGRQQWAQLIHSLTPGQNLFYAKGPLDYTLFNETQSFLSDKGYMGTLRQQMEQHRNLFGEHQKFWWE